VRSINKEVFTKIELSGRNEGKLFRCRDAGYDCSFEARCNTDAEIIKIASEHWKKVHGLRAEWLY
jgi:predicted small metal-binding protein